MKHDMAFEMATSNLRYGPGVTREVGMDLAEMGVKKAMVLTDPTLSRMAPVQTVLQSLEDAGVEAALFDRVRIEPNDVSFHEAIHFAIENQLEAFVSVGGGSVIDTAKAANLHSTHPVEDFYEYVNPPIGKGTPVPGPLRPHIAIPTTAGTGSETTGVSIFDISERHLKTGIASRLLKPMLGLVDPENTLTLPPLITASTALDVLSHSIESFTALPFNQRPMPERPALRPAYQGSNPISDIWSQKSLSLMAENLPSVMSDPGDIEARGNMILASAYAGMGFGNAGVHLPHGMSYPVSGMVRDYMPPDYTVDHPMVPHGISVVLNAPAVFRFTGQACPDRHLRAAEILGADISRAKPADAGKILADEITKLLQSLGLPNGLGALGYTREDIPALVQGTLPQHRVTKISPRPAGEEELSEIFEDAMVAW